MREKATRKKEKEKVEGREETKQNKNGKKGEYQQKERKKETEIATLNLYRLPSTTRHRRLAWQGVGVE